MPTPRPQRLARSAGALVWRPTDPEYVAAPGGSTDLADIEVPMVHRPHYHDQSWSKGKTEHGESLVTAAVRKIGEKTSQIIMPGAPPTIQHCRLGGGQTEEVHYWVGTLVPAGHASERLRAPATHAPRTEIDQAAQISPERATDMLMRRGDRRLLADIVAHARGGRLVTTAFPVLRLGQGLTPHLGGAGGARMAASLSASSGGSTAPAEAAILSKPRPVPTPAMVASAAARRTTQVEQGSVKKVETVPEPTDPPLSRFGMRQVFDLIGLLSNFGVACALTPPTAHSHQGLTSWASMGGGSVILVESLDLAVSGLDVQIDGEARLGRVRTFTAGRLREHVPPTVLSIVGTAHNAIIKKVYAYVSAPVVGGEAPCLRHDQVLVVHAEHAGDSLTVAILEAHSVTMEGPVTRTRKASKKY